ncbi:bifunctional aspartate kinase/homoserine dehydrogenase I [Buchnera aphidicola]|uniref:bifunctional aspartate kinase/homoserine dehydrogenase I n=1 Tax=Buchnera aphidicola TaxID=9 RepID=UPI0031B839C4
MKILKFGGTSLSNGKKFLHIKKIIKKKIKKNKLGIVLSAPEKITNYLDKIIKTCKKKKNFITYINNINNIIINIIKHIKIKKKNFLKKKIIKFIKIEIKHLKKIFKNIYKFKKCPKKIYSYILSKGENFSINIMYLLLKSKKNNITIIDPVKKISCKGNHIESIANIKKSSKKFKKINIKNKNIILMPGFIAGNKKKEMILLGRNGSDYSASILTACLKAKCCEIWTDVNGIYTSDPKKIKKTNLISSMNYKEAIELSYFGAKILHQKTIQPIYNLNIPCVIKNTLNINSKGTLISNNKIINKKNKKKIKGVTYLNNIFQLKIKQKNKKKIIKILKEILLFLNKFNIWSILSTKKNNTKNIIFYIKKKDLNLTKNFLIKKIKIKKKKIKINNNLSIISIIGYNLNKKKNIYTKILNSLLNINNKIIHIIQESSKYSISFIIKKKYTIKITQKIHNSLFNKKKILEIFLIGVGGVGSALLKQIKKQKKKIKKKKIKIKIYCIANSKKILINKKKLKLNNWKKKLLQSKKKFKLKKIIKFKKKKNFLNPVIIDCTSSDSLSKKYKKLAKKKFNIITSNKTFNTFSIKNYNKIRKITKKNKKKFLYETNVGAGLPIIETVKNLMQVGNKIKKITGILSGSLSYIFGKLNNKITISKATKMAIKMGFTEPNPKDDLLGIDVSRKILILAREIGYKIELKDINIQPILPKKFHKIKKKKEFMKKLPKLDKYFLKLFKKTKKEKKVLRYVGTIKSNGKCYIKLKKIKKKNPLYTVKNGENALAFYSKYYNPIPLVIKGYGAGNNVTASGIFNDLLKILS